MAFIPFDLNVVSAACDDSTTGVGKLRGKTVAKKAEVKIGQIWSAKVSGRLSRVRVLRIEKQDRGGSSRSSTTYSCININTGRQVSMRSAAKFRRLISSPQPTTISSPQPTTISSPQPTTISEREAEIKRLESLVASATVVETVKISEPPKDNFVVLYVIHLEKQPFVTRWMKVSSLEEGVKEGEQMLADAGESDSRPRWTRERVEARLRRDSYIRILDLDARYPVEHWIVKALFNAMEGFHHETL